MHTPPSLPTWLDLLRRLLPPSGVAHVGAGLGLDAARYADWGVPAAVFAEAEESLQDRLAAALAGRPGWSCHAALLAARPGERDFHVASNPDESGLVPPESLASLWRNLKTVERRSLPATTLEALLSAKDAPPAGTVNWAVIDCLPALPIIQGAGGRLAEWDVLVARAVLDAGLLPGQGASKAELDAFLAPQGFRPLACEEERHPALGHILYVRDWKGTLLPRLADLQARLSRQTDESARLAGDLKKAQDSHNQHAEEQQARIAQLTQQRDEQARLAAGRQEQIDRLGQERDEQAARAAGLQAQLQQAAQARDEQAALAAGLQAQLQQAAQARDEQAALAAERQAQLERADKARDEQARLAAERQAHQEQANQAQAVRILGLEAELGESRRRHEGLKRELANAEEQIDLIEEMLLRQPER